MLCRTFAALAVFTWAAWLSAAEPPPDAPSPFNSRAPAGPQVSRLREAWHAARDPEKRKELGAQLRSALMQTESEHGVADEVSRDGGPENLLTPISPPRVIVLPPGYILKDVQRLDDDYQPSPVFRRLSRHRVEAWTTAEGWLFDAQGRNLADVKVPRRDGQGREWRGAFLPNGTWITTDLWANDQQLNCFNAQALWRWELPGTRMSARIPRRGDDAETDPIVPSTGWARADRTGRRWLVCLGTDFTRGCVFVDSQRRIQGVPPGDNIWSQVYPRSMGVRGMYTDLSISSDDGRENLGRSEAGHGAGVGWPTYSLPGNDVVIHNGNFHFGFWPGTHQTYFEADGSPDQTWFFSAAGKYQGQIAGSFLGDAANGCNLLIKDPEGHVIELSNGKRGLAIAGRRVFKWADGSLAVPLALYDDLKVGFFLRGPGLLGDDDQARAARAKAKTVCSRWQ